MAHSFLQFCLIDHLSISIWNARESLLVSQLGNNFKSVEVEPKNLMVLFLICKFLHDSDREAIHTAIPMLATAQCSHSLVLFLQTTQSGK